MTTQQSDKNQVYLETNARFSQSRIWDFQKEYFDRKGITAWVGGVPYYVTSNSVIAYSYAQMTLRYFQDGLKNGLIKPEETVYILELGTGSGRFSYQFLTFFTQFLQSYDVNYKFCYVMTDFTQSNLQYWQNHTQFQTFIKNGVLDFAIYNIGNDEPIHLKNQNITLDKGKCQNPLILVANYIFDTVTHDAFRVENGQLHEGLISLMTEPNNLTPEHTLKEMNGLKTRFDFKPIKSNYYPNEALNDILAHYEKSIKTGTFLIPTGAIKCIDHLRSFSNGKLLIISADKGYLKQSSLENLATPHIAFHGSFSMMVNFDAIRRYTEFHQGEALLSDETEGIKISLFSFGSKFTKMHETRWAYGYFVNHFSTKEFLPVKNKLIEHAPELTLLDFLALLKLSHWDPDIFVAVAHEWAQKLTDASNPYLAELRAGLAEIYNNYYFIPNYKNPLFELGHIYHVIGDLDMAIQRYSESMTRFSADTATYMNLGLCYYYKEQSPQALKYFESALKLDANCESAKEWIGFIKDQ